LRAKLSPAEKKIIEERPTADLVAYDLYLQAKGMNVFFGSGDQREAFLKQVTLLSEATRRDPGFALAYCLLARAHGFLYQAFYDHTSQRRAQAEAAVNEAVRLRPDLVETRLALTDYLYRVERDYDRARTQLAIVQHRTSRGGNAAPLTPMIPISFRKGDTVLNYFSMVTTLGTPQTVAAQEMRIESMFPADETTEKEHAAFLRAGR
jgi:hypothetical protein